MAKFKIHKSKDYTIMSNIHLKEKEMSLKAKGLLSVMFSLPENWNYSIDGLVAICKENETAIKSTLDEIKSFGYLTVTKLLPNKTKSGRIEYVYDIYEIPKQEGRKQALENLPLEFLPLENQGQLITKVLSNTHTSNNKHSNTKISIHEIINEYHFSEDVKFKIFEWLEYKKEKNQGYKEKGFRAFCKQRLEEISKYGDRYVIDMIDYSMCQNYSGLFPPKTNNDKKPTTEVEKPRYGDFDPEEAFRAALARSYREYADDE